MKRLGWVGLILILTLALLSGCAPKGSAANTTAPVGGDGSLDRVKKAGKLVIGIDDTFPPMEFRNDKNELVGFEVELDQEIGKRLGVKIEWQPTEWSTIIGALQAKRFDMILSGMTVTPERAKEVAFGTPYFNGAQVLAVRPGSTAKTPADLKGKVVASQLGSSSAVSAAKWLNVKQEDLKLYNSFTEAFTDLSNSRVDGLVVDELTARYYLTQRPGAFTILNEKLDPEPAAAAFRKDDAQLRQEIDRIIAEIKTDGTWERISMKWFGAVLK
ncbi:MAG: amino acid ABC transporter substrate-binding protein [Bacillota bacterium]